jgi:hypothetical protein
MHQQYEHEFKQRIPFDFNKSLEPKPKQKLIGNHPVKATLWECTQCDKVLSSRRNRKKYFLYDSRARHGCFMEAKKEYNKCSKKPTPGDWVKLGYFRQVGYRMNKRNFFFAR